MIPSIKKYLPKTLFARTFLIVVVPVLILQLAVAGVFFDRHWSKMTQRLAVAVSGEIAMTVDLIKMTSNDGGKTEHIQSLMQSHLSMPVTIDRNSETLPEPSGDGFIGVAKDLNKVMAGEITDPFQISVFDADKLIVVDILVPSVGVVQFKVPEGRLFSSSSYIFILWMVGLSLILFTIALMFMRNQIRPIYRLGLIAERMGRGIPVGRFKPTGAREVRQAAEAFILMQDRINGFIHQRTTMLAGVSHDLRTPLTRMKLQLELLGDTPDAEAMKKDIFDMEHMIEGYLSFAKGDEGEETKRISLKEFLDEIGHDARRLNLNVTENHVNIDDRLFWCKPKALHRAFGNFLSNAARYADTIEIATEVNDGSVCITISDNGPGISDDMREDVMKPFFRGEQSRNQKTGGVGLGLTIANDIITSHAGQIALDHSKRGGGLKVIVTLPL
ncbi:MAG: two-component sensor histidine kinase [Alphaproteobacteria bacterium]|nr:MAG: two-component sensor histidine kinase [Alphaproteobacteria bacterium]